MRLQTVTVVLFLLFGSAFADQTTTVDKEQSNRIGEQFAGVYTLGCQEGIATEKSTMTKDSDVYETTWYKKGSNCTEIESVSRREYELVYPGGTTMTEFGEAVHVNIILRAAVYDGKDVFDSPSTDYSIMLLDGDKLYVAYGFGRSPEHRPTELKELYWTKQQ